MKIDFYNALVPHKGIDENQKKYNYNYSGSLIPTISISRYRNPNILAYDYSITIGILFWGIRIIVYTKKID